MNDQEPTHHLSPFETLVLQRFDQIDARLLTLEAKAVDTRPIWEQALAEIVGIKADIVEIKADIVTIKADIVTIKADIVEIKADIVEIKTGLDGMEKRVHRVERGLGILAEDVVQVRVDLRGLDNRIIALERE